MSKRCVWKNTPEGKTVRRNSLATYYGSRPVELMESFALRVLSRAAHLTLLRIEIELRHHAGRGNGKLISTKEDFIAFGVYNDSVAPALRELEALGIVIVTQRGRGGNAEHRQPNCFRLNYLCGAVEDPVAPTDTWRRFKTIEEAQYAARKARDTKDPHKVALGRRSAGSKNISQSGKPGPISVRKTRTETEKFSVRKTRTTGPVRKTRTTIDISGGGGVSGGQSRKKHSGREAACRYCGELADKAVLIELYDGFFIHAECQEEWRSNGRGKN